MTPRPRPPRSTVGSSWRRNVLLALAGASILIAGYLMLGSRREAWPAPALRQGNVLLITLDTVRADRLAPSAARSLAPALERLMREGRTFTRSYSHAPLTLPAHASILTGVPPPEHGVRGNGSFRLDEAQVTLAERLAADGYRTGAFVGAFVLDARFGLNQGFDEYDGVPDERTFAQDFAFAERRAPAVLASAERWILGPAEEALTAPWFAWVHLFDPHAPYDAPATLAADPYDNEIAYVDRELGGFLDRLRTRGALARTFILVTADHGEGLGEHGERTHGLFAYDTTLRVPLIVQGPGIGHGVHEGLATHSDIVPTVLDLVGLPADDLLPGRSLREVSQQRGAGAAYLEALDGWLTAGAAPLTALVEGAWKFVEAPDPELYDLAADPAEQQNRFAAEPDRARAMAERLRASAGTRTPMTTAGPDADAAARLRALGYASGSPPAAGRPYTSADDPKAVRPLYERFLDVLAGSSPEGVDQLLAIVAARPAFVAARMTAASMLLEGGRAAEAVSLLEREAASPHAPLGLRERFGAALLASGRAADAERVLAAVVENPQASAEAWNTLGVARATGGRGAEAAAAFDRAVALAPDAARFLFNRALASVEAGDAARALADLRTLTATHPRFADGWRALADVQIRRGDRAGAVQAWQQVVALQPEDVDTWFNLAVTLRDLGRLDEARRAAGAFLARASPAQHPREIREMEGIGREKN